MGAAAGFHADQTRRELHDQRQELLAADTGFDQFCLAGFVDTMDGKDVLGQINSDDDKTHDFPSWWC